MLVLPAAFDTIDHDHLFCILEKYVVICGNALKLIKSYFSNRTQRVQLRCDLSGLSVNVGGSQITQSLKGRDLGVTFNQFLNFDDHMTAICRSTYFHIRNIENYDFYGIMLVLLLFMHLLFYFPIV